MADKDNTEKNEYQSDCDNLRFEVQEIHFFPDDIEKMKTMDIEARIAYKRKLKEEQRYIVDFSKNEE